MSEEQTLTVQLVSPEGVLWEGESTFVVLPAYDGELGIYPDHAPLLARLGTGETRIHTKGGVEYFALFGGFLEVVHNRVQVIVDRAETPATIDVEAANRDLEKVGAKGIKDVTRHEEELLLRVQAQTRLKVAAKKG
ncbi:MAG: F0F1 ATP synthase subunit epsilon [Planctomycetota bacterium]|jgi:F-type H+-transporting ATPase subunit epsilon